MSTNLAPDKHQSHFFVQAPPPQPVFPHDPMKNQVSDVHQTKPDTAWSIADLYGPANGDSRACNADAHVTSPMKRGATIRQITQDFLKTTNMHALPHITSAPFRCLRLLWFFIFIVMCVLLGLHTQTIITKYYAYPTQVTIKIQREDSLEFPAVTVCNQNPVPRSILKTTAMKQFVLLDTEMACGRLNGTSCKDFKPAALSRYEAAALRCANRTIKCRRLRNNYGYNYGNNNNDYHYNYTYGSIYDYPNFNPIDPYQFVMNQTQPGDYNQSYDFDYNNSFYDNWNYDYDDTSTTEAPTWDSVSPLDEPGQASGDGVTPPSSVEHQTKATTTADSTTYSSVYDYMIAGFNHFEYYNNYDDYEYHDDTFSSAGKTVKASRIEDVVRESRVSDLTDVTNMINIKYNEILSGENGTTIEDFILECSYDRQHCDTSDEVFATFYNKAYGKCYTFNSKIGHIDHNHSAGDAKARLARRYGSEYGLRLTLNINESEYVGLLASAYGARMTVHAPAETPYPHLDGFDAPPGTVTVAAIKRVYIVRLSDPFESMCFDQIPEEYRKYGLAEGGISYSLRACRIACMDSAMFETCGCIDQTTFADVTKHSLFQSCNVFNKTQLSCQRRVTRQFQLSSDNAAARKCDCSAACNETSYRRTLSTAKWPTRQFVDLYVNNMPMDSRIWKMYNRVGEAEDSFMYYGASAMDTVANNLVRIHVYYEELNYEFIEEHEAYAIANLLADLGGVIGLYLGLSVSTVFEVVQYFAFLTMFKCYKTEQ